MLSYILNLLLNICVKKKNENYINFFKQTIFTFKVKYLNILISCKFVTTSISIYSYIIWIPRLFMIILYVIILQIGMLAHKTKKKCLPYLMVVC